MIPGEVLYRARAYDTPDNPFTDGLARPGFRYDDDLGLVVSAQGVITARGPFAAMAAASPQATVIDLRAGILLPGLVDTHVHFPQVRVIGALGMPLLEWLDRCALPEEQHLASPDYAATIAGEFVAGLIAAGTTTSLVFGSHFAPAMDALFARAAHFGLRVTSGLVVSDRMLPEPLLTTPERAYAESLALAARWHGVGHARYAVTPRFSLSASDPILAACASVMSEVEGAFFTSHVNENLIEVATVRGQFPERSGYVDTYDHHGLLGPRSVLAHNVHPLDAELAALADRSTSVAHCPSSNSALGSGLFSLRRHVASGVPVALGSDVGAGTGFSLFKEGLQAYFVQRLLGDQGLPLAPGHLLHLSTSAGAAALGLGEVIGDFSEGKQFDAICLRPPAGTSLDIGLRHAGSPEEALGKVFALAGDADVADVWIAGEQIASGGLLRPVSPLTPARRHMPAVSGSRGIRR
ncbi:MAG: guanine deaminase [Nocardioides sp.]|jgi:guanine deaminase|uniref:guanine deaminase n=1 Tax=Nocardioides sp. TaxID=35761 RepID=UPI0026099914|nr:guanine deaminase [Nocardioides sp.]MCW2832537.1 guanine deaminase [Nocardioides sp.]